MPGKKREAKKVMNEKILEIVFVFGCFNWNLFLSIHVLCYKIKVREREREREREKFEVAKYLLMT